MFGSLLGCSKADSGSETSSSDSPASSDNDDFGSATAVHCVSGGGRYLLASFAHRLYVFERASDSGRYEKVSETLGVPLFVECKACDWQEASRSQFLIGFTWVRVA